VRRDLDWRQFRQPRQASIAAGVLAMIVATTAVVFVQNWLPILFLPVLPLMIATFAYQRIGAAAGIVVVALVGGVMTLEGTGPVMLIHASEAVRLQFFNFYVAVLFLVTLPVAAILAQRDQLSRRLGEREAFYRLLADHATDIMLTMDADGTIRFASPSVRELGFFEPEALIGRNAAELVHPEDVGRIRRAHLAAIADPHHTHNMEYRAIKANGAVNWFETNTRAVRGDDGQIETVVSVIRDLSDRKRREDELVRAATTDPLTGLLNRVAFHHAMADAVTAAKRGVPATLALLDLDHFKRVNDTHGHATGDAALLMLADLLRDNLRGEDIVGRIGGEEFAILFPGAPLSAAAAVCQRLCARLARAELDASGTQISITMSMGLTSVMPHMTIEEALRIADEALYAAKHAGRNRIQLAEPEPLR
jgi:diguanylate cyclase (GGDEF)-like protein/PAS domain S-box-containing protein